jgi:hypothetical protein
VLEEDDIDGLAAEYVLGSLSVAERREVDARRQTDTALAAAIVAWERRLGPLGERTPDEAPAAHLFDAVLLRISAETAQAASAAAVVPLRRATGRRWAIAAAASALAASLALMVAWQSPQQMHGAMECGRLYKSFWEKRDPASYARITPEQLAGISRLALRAYDACQAGDEQDAGSLFVRLQRVLDALPPERRGDLLYRLRSLVETLQWVTAQSAGEARPRMPTVVRVW